MSICLLNDTMLSLIVTLLFPFNCSGLLIVSYSSSHLPSLSVYLSFFLSLSLSLSSFLSFLPPFRDVMQYVTGTGKGNRPENRDFAPFSIAPSGEDPFILIFVYTS